MRYHESVVLAGTCVEKFTVEIGNWCPLLKFDGPDQQLDI